MIRRTLSIVLLFIAVSSHADWETIAPGVSYRHYTTDTTDIHVARVDLTNDMIRVIATREDERGLRVSEYAKKNNAIVAVNGDYFDDKLNPIGLVIGGVAAGKPRKTLRAKASSRSATDAGESIRSEKSWTRPKNGLRLLYLAGRRSLKNARH